MLILFLKYLLVCIFYVCVCVCLYITTNKAKRGHEFERDQERVYRNVWGEKIKRRNAIIL